MMSFGLQVSWRLAVELGFPGSWVSSVVMAQEHAERGSHSSVKVLALGGEVHETPKT